MEQILIEALERLMNKKREANIKPEHILDIELRKEITRMTREAAFKLRERNRVKLGRTINSNYIELLEKA